jgi:hypothetical protein
MTVETLLQEIRTLTPADRQRILQEIISMQRGVISVSETPEHSILEFGGVGAEIWSGIDAQEYVNKLREEWDE